METRFNFLWFLILLALIFIYGKVDKDMIDMYVALVMAGRRTCNEENKSVSLVPLKWRAAVLADLTALGLDADGNAM